MLHAECAQQLPFLVAARRRKHLGTDVEGDLDGCLSDAARSCVNQHAFASLQVGEMLEAYGCGEKRDGNPRRFGGAEARIRRRRAPRALSHAKQSSVEPVP